MNFSLVLLIVLSGAVRAGEERWEMAVRGREVEFVSWSDQGSRSLSGLLVLVPGYNGDGEQMLDARWKEFAAQHNLVLLAPTFRAEGDEVRRGRGYYYPEQGSGGVMEAALEELHRRTGVNIDKVLFFGFSAGAHFSHRFALWKPERVKAYVTYSAAWWSDPDASQRAVPALIMCGETDFRYDATFRFFKKGQELGCPWIWRSYEDTGHELTPAVRDMAEAFLAHHVREMGSLERSEPRYGDIQRFKSVAAAEKETIAAEFRIELPSARVAQVWEKEDQ